MAGETPWSAGETPVEEGVVAGPGASTIDLPPRVAGALDRLGELIQQFEQHPEAAVQQRALEMLQCLDVIHRAGLRRLGSLLDMAGLQRHALDDPTVGLLFDLYDLTEGGERARVNAVLDEVRPYLVEEGGQVDLVETTPESVKVRLTVAPGAQQDPATLREAVEQTLFVGLPDFERIEVEEASPRPPRPAPPPPSGFVPLSALLGPSRPTLTWQPLCSIDDVPTGEVRGMEADGMALLVARLGPQEVYLYRNLCPGSPLPLHLGRVEDDVLHCPWHQCRFDLRGGRRVEGEGPGLGVIPVRVTGAQVLLGVRQESAA